jgi:hypothetical protein
MKLLEEYTEFNFNITKSNNNWINKSKLLEEDSNKQPIFDNYENYTNPLLENPVVMAAVDLLSEGF